MLRTTLVLGAFALFALSRAADCLPGSRVTSCQKNEDCPMRDGGGKMVCDNLRCVECAYDADCPEGTICGGNKTCETLGARGEKEAEPPPPAASLEECAKRCKGNQACASACRDQFK